MNTTYRFAALVAVSLVSPIAAQQAPSQAQQQVAALKTTLAQDKAALRKYSWTEITEIAVKGEVKKLTRKECHYGPDGQVQKTALEDGQPQGGGRQRGLKGKIVAKKTAELKDDMTAIAELVHQYVPPDAERTQEAVQAGNASLSPKPGGAMAVAFANYVKPGDKLSIEIDPATSKIRNISVSTYYEGTDDPVSFVATFDALPDGTGYMRQTQLDSPKRQVRVTITNAHHEKTSS